MSLSTSGTNFGENSQIVYTLTRSAGLSASDFYFLDTGGTSTYSGAHVQGIVGGGDSSSWIDPSSPVYAAAVPEASTFAVPVFGLAVAGFAVYRRKRSSKA
jgi:hypothetical protein